MRSGIKTVLIPKDNEKDLVEIPNNVKDGLKIIPVQNVDEVLKHALVQALTPITWIDPEEISPAGQKQDEANRGVITH